MSCFNCGSTKINDELEKVKEAARIQAIKKGECQEIWKEYGFYKYGNAPQGVNIIDTISPHG